MPTEGYDLETLSASAEVGYAEVLKAGLLDSLSPAMLTIMVFFLWQMYLAARHTGRCCRWGGIFVGGVFTARCGQILGLFDPFLDRKMVWDLIDASMLIMALAAFVIGAVLFRDWVFAKLNAEDKPPRIDLKCLWPGQTVSPSGGNPRSGDEVEPAGRRLRKNIAAAFLSFLGAWAAVFMACAWSEHGSLWFILYELSLPDDMLQNVLMVLVYGAAFIWPVFLIWVFFCRIQRSLFFRDHAPSISAKIRILASAFFTGYALGILKVYWDFFSQS